MSAPSRYLFVPLGRQHDRAAFSCGVEPLDRYFREHAGQDMRARVTAVFVLHDTATDAIIGFYTLSAFGIQPQSLSPEVLRRLPRYDLLPASLLGRLAVDHRYRRQEFGEMLLFDALRRTWEQSAVIGAIAVVVDAKDDAARTFYERYGFQRFLDDEYRLYLPMQTIERTLRNAS